MRSSSTFARVYSISLVLAAGFTIAGCRFNNGTVSEALDEQSEQVLAETMIKRLDNSCGTGGCHNSEAGVLYSAAITKFAQFTAPVHNCFVYNYCYQDDLTAQGAKDCLNRCVVSHDLSAGDFNLGIFHATTRGDGFLRQLAVKANMLSAMSNVFAMPPSAPAVGAPDLSASPKKFKELADWLTTQVEDRAFRQLIEARGRPLDDWDLPFIASAPHMDGVCGDTPQVLLDLIDDDFKLNDVKMYGCSTNWPSDPNTCLADHADSPWRNPDPKAVDVLTNEVIAAPGLKVKILRKLDGRQTTSYWTRSSPDGRFVSTGNGQIEDLAVGGATPEGRTIEVLDGSIDPGYDPTNRYYVWPGLICPMAPLYDQTLTQAGRSIEASKCRDIDIGTYASFGSISGDRTIEVEGDNSNNAGWRKKDAGVYPGDNSVILKEVDAVQMTLGLRHRFKVTDEADFLLSPTGKVLVNRGLDSDSKQLYRMRMVQDAEGELGSTPQDWYLTDNSKAATICMRGEKPMTSFDNRFITFHHHADGSPQDVGANVEHSNIFVYDMKYKRYIRVTQQADGSKAYFPHFRADGWLYFEVIKYPQTEGEDITFELLASNAAIVLKNLPAPQ